MAECKWIQDGREIGNMTGPWRPVEGDFIEDLASGTIVQIVKCTWKGAVLYCDVTVSGYRKK